MSRHGRYRRGRLEVRWSRHKLRANRRIRGGSRIAEGKCEGDIYPEYVAGALDPDDLDVEDASISKTNR
jgi:hypothetical protein